MDNKVSCPKCSRFVSAESGRLPPWCPGCGSILKPAPAPPAPPPLPDASSIVPLAAPVTLTRVAPREAPTYFHGFVPSSIGSEHMLYRLYPTSTDLLVFAIGIGTVNYGQVVPRAARQPVGPGGVAMAFEVMRETSQRKLLARIPELDAACEETLRSLAVWGKDEFVASLEDLRGARLDPPSFWNRMLGGSQHVGVLTFRHRKQGKVVLALPAFGDARKAAEGLIQLQGDGASINLEWKSKGKR
jgi:hypothetical protein